jgi:amino acid transporter
MADTNLAAATGQDQLAHGTLRIWDAIAISVSVIAPGMAMLLNTTGVAAAAGGSTPLAFLLGGIACLALAFVVIGFTRRMASAGYAYTYASRSLGKSAGFIAGWLYFFGMICFVPMTMSGVGYLAADLTHTSPKLWILFFFIGMALFVLLSVIRIRVTTRVQLVVGALTIAAIIIVNLVTTAKGGSHGQDGSAFTFGHTINGGFNGVFYGIIFGVTSYIGFETAADFGEETANPRRYIPIAIIAATLFAIVFYLWTTYSIAIGYGVGNGSKWAADPVALKTTATTFVGSWLGTIVEIGGMLSAFIVSVACATAGARTLFAMGREKVLPAWFGHTHPKYKTPVNATLAVAVVAIVMGLLIGYPLSDATFGNPFSNYYFWATAGTLLVIVVYIMLCLGGMVFFWKTRATRRWNVVAHVVVPLIGAVVFGAAWYGSVHPTPAGIIKWTPYVALAWLVIGLAVVFWLRSARPEAVARIGSILGEEGGEDAAVLDVAAGPAHGTASSLSAARFGAILRQPWLREARAKHKQGELTIGQLREAEDRAAAENIALQREAGIMVFTDGEVRRENWMAGLLESIGGMTSVGNPDGVAWRREDGDSPPARETDFDLTVASAKVFRKTKLTSVEAEYLAGQVPGRFKITMMSAAMGGLSWRPDISAAAYPSPAELTSDLIRLQIEEVGDLVDRGVPTPPSQAPPRPRTPRSRSPCTSAVATTAAPTWRRAAMSRWRSGSSARWR